jgi:hypothetical protein
VAQHGQVLKLRTRRRDGKARWAYRYRVNGSGSKRPQVDLGLTDQERLIAFGLERPFVRCASDERNPHALVGEGMPLVPDKPPLADRDTAAEITGSLGADTLRGWRRSGSGRRRCSTPAARERSRRRAQTTSAGASIQIDASSRIVRPVSQTCALFRFMRLR